jgi:HEPN domain-containing protein
MAYNKYIQILEKQAEEDYGAADALFRAGYYGQCLFWSHLVLEKLVKALWIFKNKKQNYPYIHNLLRLLKDCDVELSDEQIIFYSEMNQFQARGRYGDFLGKLENTVSFEISEKLMNETKSQMIWIKQQMGKR